MTLEARARNSAKQKALGYRTLHALAQRLGDTFYVYDEDRFVHNYMNLLETFQEIYPRTTIAYSYKTNYLPSLCARVDALGGFAEIVSSMEYAIVETLRIDRSRVIFNGPCKDPRTVEAILIGGGIVNLDSVADLDIVLSVARRHPARHLRVGLRCNLKDSRLPWSRFGLEVGGREFRQAVDALRARPNIRLSGLHCHYPCRDLDSFQARTEAMLRASDAIWKDSPEFLNFGGGFAGEMPKSLSSQFAYEVPCYRDYAQCVAGAVARRFPAAANEHPHLFIEPGTGIVADCMRFVTRIRVVKEIQKKRIAISGGSMFNTSPTATSIRLPLSVVPKPRRQAARSAKTDVVGYTCIEGDYLAHAVPWELRAGDFLIFENVGSYSVVMKPPFILPNVPIIRLVDGAQQYEIVKRAEAPADVFRTFPEFCGRT